MNFKTSYNLAQRKYLVINFIVLNARNGNDLEPILKTFIKNRYQNWNFDHLCQLLNDSQYNLLKTL